MPRVPKKMDYAGKLYRDHRNRNYYIIKHNDIVQNAHFSMPLADQKVLASLIRTIKPGQKSLTVRFSTMTFIRMLGLSSGGSTFNEVMNALSHVGNDNFFIKLPDGHYHWWTWIQDIDVDPKHGGTFWVTFNPRLRKYLFAKSLKYRTIYRFSDIMLMKSRYSIRLYEIFRSNQSRQKVQKRGLNYSIAELKYLLNLMKRKDNKRNDLKPSKIITNKHGDIVYRYPRFSDFKRRVLAPAVREINLLTEYRIRIRTIRHGRSATGVNVVMLKKNKKQRQKRDLIIYFMVHHVPRSKWKTWRHDMIYHRQRRRTSRQKRRALKGNFHVVHSHQEDLFKQDKIPFQEINLRSGKIEYYSPLVHKYIWTSKEERDGQKSLYKKIQKIHKDF